MSRAATRSWQLLALVLGAGLMLGYAAWQILEPHGPREFAYAPFAVEPLPYASMRGFTYEQLWGHVRRILLLGPGLVLFTWGLVGRVRLAAPTELGRHLRWFCAASLLLTACLMLFVLRGRVLFDDELAYSMQAGFFADGRLTGPDLGLNPNDYFNVWTPRGYTVKYLPGEPLLQVPGVLVGVPALAHLPVLALTLFAWYRCLRRSSGERIAALGTIALGCSPMLIFTTATGLSHASGLLWVVLMGLGLEQARDGSTLRGAALSGLALGGGLFTRPQSILPVAVVLGAALLLELWRRRAWPAFAALALTGGGGAAALLAYNQLLTGTPFKLPWSQQCDSTHFGFGHVWTLSTYEHTLRTAIENLGVVALRLNAWWLGLPVSLAVVAGFFLLRLRTGRAAVWLWAGLAVLAFEFFYYSPGVGDTGAIYHYELLLPGSLMAAALAATLLLRFASWAPLALVSGLVFGTGTWLLEQGLRFDRLVSLIHRDSDQVLSRIAPSAPALLIHERLEVEVVSRGWVLSSFPQRFRRPSDPIVTLPRITPDILERAQRAYPGRSCWYFHRLAGTSTPELLRCEQARELMARPAIDTDVQFRDVYWERPTAYFEADYQPFTPIFQRRLRGRDGAPVMACCQIRTLEQIGVRGTPEARARCVETGDR